MNIDYSGCSVQSGCNAHWDTLGHNILLLMFKYTQSMLFIHEIAIKPEVWSSPSLKNFIDYFNYFKLQR